MHCPNCGTQASAEQKFCRACGLELQAIGRLIAEQLAGKTGLPHVQSDAAQSARGFRFIFAGVCLFACGLALLAINHVLQIDRIIDLPAVFLCLIGMLVMLYSQLAPLMRAPRLVAQTPLPDELPAADTTNKLALGPGVEPGASVVEHTTRTLEPVAARPGEQS